MVTPLLDPPAPATKERLAHEYGLKDELEGAWAARPLELVREHGRTLLVLEDPRGVPLARLVGRPMDTGRFLHLALPGRIVAEITSAVDPPTIAFTELAGLVTGPPTG